MPDFLAPFPPTLTPTTESQAFSGSSLSLSSNSSFNYFGHHSYASSGSAYLSDITPPITPSYTDDDKGHEKSYNDCRIPVVLSHKKEFQDRERRALISVGEAEDTGYDSDCEREDAPLLDAVEMVHARLEKAKCTTNTKRALKIMEEHMNPAFESSDALLDEPLLMTPSMPAMKVVVTKAEGDIMDWTEEFKNGANVKAETANPPVEEVGPTPTPTPEFSFILDKDQIWEMFANSTFEREFHEGVREEAGRSFFPDEIKLHPANSFAFGTGSISGWREKPARDDAPVEAQVHSDFESFSVERVEPASDIPVEHEAVPHSPLLISLSPVMPEKPVLRPLDDHDWSGSPFSLGSPSLVFDTSVSVSQMLVSPQNLDAAPTASSPGVYDISHHNPNSPLNSPLMAISTLMFASRRSRLPPADILTAGQDLDLPDLMRLEVAAAITVHPQQQQLEASTTPDDPPSGDFGLGFDIHPFQLPESSFPSCSSLPSIYSLPSWDAEAAPTTSTPSLQACNIFHGAGSSGTIASATESEAGTADVHLANASEGMVISSMPSRQALSDITEESTRGVALANESNKETESSVVVGLGLGALLESTLQSSSSISAMCSPELPPPSIGRGPKVNASLSTSVSMMDLVDGRYHPPIAPISDPVIESSQDFERDSPSANARFSQIEPSGVLSEMPQEIRHYSPGVENWRRFCAEVEPLSVPLNSEISSISPNVNGALTPGYCYYSKIDPSLGLSEESSSGASFHRQALAGIQGLPLSFRFSPEHDDIAFIDQETFPHCLVAETDPRSPVSPTHQIHHTSTGFGVYRLSPIQPIAVSDVGQSQSPDFIIEEVLRSPLSTSAPVTDLVSCAPPSEHSSLKSSKSIEGIGMGLPSNLAGRPPRPHDASSNGSDSVPKPMMATAEEIQNLAKLASSSPTTNSASPNFMVSEERDGSRFFFKIPKFAKRSLYVIPEVRSPGSSPGAGSSTSGGRLLSAAWSDFTNCLRSPSRKSGPSKFSNSTPQSTPPLAGPPGDARSSNGSSATAITQLPAIVPDIPSSSVSSTKDISNLPQPPVLVPRQPRFSILERLSGFSRSPPIQSVQEGAMSPGVVEHLDVPRGLGIFKRRPSPVTTPPDRVKHKERRFKPALSRFQLLF